MTDKITAGLISAPSIHSAGQRKLVSPEFILPVPYIHKQQPDNGATQMCPAGDVVPGAVANGLCKFKNHVENDEPFGFNRDKKVEVNERIGK